MPTASRQRRTGRLATDTIGYEIVTRVGARIPRSYTGEDAQVTRAPTSTALGLGIGLAAAGAATAGIAADRLTKSRRRAPSTLTPTGAYEHVADEELVVVASDGVPLHVEVDEPDPGRGQSRPPHRGLQPRLHPQPQELGAPAPGLVQAGYRVVLWDQRSHGQSEQGSRESSTIDQLGRDLSHRVIQEAAPEGRLVLIGHSMGGMTVMSMASSSRRSSASGSSPRRSSPRARAAATWSRSGSASSSES